MYWENWRKEGGRGSWGDTAEEHSRQGAQHVQRPRGRPVLGVLEGQREGPPGWG